MPEGVGYSGHTPAIEKGLPKATRVEKGDPAALGNQYEGFGDGELTSDTKSATSTVRMSLAAKGNRPIVDNTPMVSSPNDAPNRPSNVAVKSTKRF